MRGHSLRTTVLTLGVGAMLAVTGCSDDGRDLRATQPWQTTTTRPAPPTSPPARQSSASGMTLSSPLFAPGGALPASATCGGGNTFPDLAWSGVPPLAVELVVTLSDQTDPAAPTLLWLLAGIEPSLTGLEAGRIPIGAFETLNGFDSPGYGNPCLETVAGGRRELQFRVHVLTQPSGIAPGEAGQRAWDLTRKASMESASVLATIDNP